MTATDQPTEVCPGCHFDPGAWDDRDLDRTLRLAAEFEALALEGFPKPWGHYRQAIVAGQQSFDLPTIRQTLAAQPEQALAVTHALFHQMHRIALIRHEAEDIVALTGTVRQVNGSNGGVPKEPVLSGVIDRRGLVGDRQATREHHGRPWQAVCLWSSDVIDELATKGHPIAPGCAGENLTLAGIDWSAMRSGLHVRIGEIHAVLSAPAEPCSKVGKFFSNRQISRIDHKLHPGYARWYASVITGGSVSPGDPVTISSSTTVSSSAEGR